MTNCMNKQDTNNEMGKGIDLLNRRRQFVKS